MPQVKSKYSQAQVKEIYNTFADDNIYTIIYNSFYNNASKDERKKAAELRSKIIEITRDSTNFKGPNSVAYVEQLDSLLVQYKDGATSIRLSEKYAKKERVNLVNSTKNLLRIVDGLTTNIFKFEDPEKYAKKLVSSSDSKTQMKFSRLQAYTAIAKNLIAKENGKERKYTESEEKSIVTALGKDALKQEYNLRDVYSELNTSYQEVANVDFVKATAKTNYLKRAGVHAKQIILAGVATGAAMFVLGSSVAAGAPVNASFLSTMKYFATATLPWAGAGLLTVGGYNAIRRAVVNGRARKVREQIRTQIGNKALFFEILNRTRPKALSRTENFLYALEDKQKRKINLSDTHFTEKSLSRLLNSTRIKMMFSFTQKRKQAVLESFKIKLAAKGIRGDLPSDTELKGILAENYGGKAKKARIDDAINNLQTELKKNEKALLAAGMTSLNIDLGTFKPYMRKNYMHLLETEDKISRSQKLLGAPMFTTRRKKKLEKERENIIANNNMETINISNLSAKNPICPILNITGTKARTTRTSVREREPAIPTQPQILAFAHQEEAIDRTQEVINDVAHEKDRENFIDIAQRISDANLRKDTARYKFNELNAEFVIAISKSNAIDSKTETAEILANLRRILSKTAKNGIVNETSQYTFGQDANSVDVSITLKTKKTKK